MRKNLSQLAREEHGICFILHGSDVVDYCKCMMLFKESGVVSPSGKSHAHRIRKSLDLRLEMSLEIQEAIRANGFRFLDERLDRRVFLNALPIHSVL